MKSDNQFINDFFRTKYFFASNDQKIEFQLSFENEFYFQ